MWIWKGEDGDEESLRVHTQRLRRRGFGGGRWLLSASLSPAGGSIEQRRGCDDKTDGLTYF